MRTFTNYNLIKLKEITMSNQKKIEVAEEQAVEVHNSVCQDCGASFDANVSGILTGLGTISEVCVCQKCSRDKSISINTKDPVNVVPDTREDRARPVDGHTQAEEIDYSRVQPLYEIIDEAEIEHKKVLKTYYARVNEIARQKLAHANDKDWVSPDAPVLPAKPTCLTQEQQAIVDLYEEQVWRKVVKAGYNRPELDRLQFNLGQPKIVNGVAQMNAKGYPETEWRRAIVAPIPNEIFKVNRNAVIQNGETTIPAWGLSQGIYRSYVKVIYKTLKRHGDFLVEEGKEYPLYSSVRESKSKAGNYFLSCTVMLGGGTALSFRLFKGSKTSRSV